MAQIRSEELERDLAAERAEQDAANVRTEAAVEIRRLSEIVARQAEEVDALRKRVRDLEALGPARREAPSRPRCGSSSGEDDGRQAVRATSGRGV